MVIWEAEGNVENTSRRRVFSTFLECSQMTEVFYHSVIHGLGFFIRFVQLQLDKDLRITEMCANKLLCYYKK